MGRELKRVPVDFDAPISATWSGYVHPKWRACPSDDCDNGSTIAGSYLSALTHLILMLGSDDRSLHPWLAELPLGPRRKPGPDGVLLSGGLAGRAPRGSMGHDALDNWAAVRKIIAAAGLPDAWGTCTLCGGNAIHPDDLAASEAWEPTEPPVGDGYQLWETTSEGSPVSPVFASLDELCEYAAGNCTTFGSARTSAAEWKRMLSDGFVAHKTTLRDGSRAIFI